MINELFGDVSDLDVDESLPSEEEEEEEEEGEVRLHPEIQGLRIRSKLLDAAFITPLLPHLHALFDKDSGANQAMRFGPSAFPPAMQPLLAIAQSLLPPSLASRSPAFDQMIANWYEPGQGIVPHVDLARFEDGVVVFSFLSALVMEFRPVKEIDAVAVGGYSMSSFAFGSEKRVDVLLEEGSAICLAGDSRFRWTHGIAERSQDMFNGRVIQRGQRISVTLRKMKPHQVGE